MKRYESSQVDVSIQLSCCPDKLSTLLEELELKLVKLIWIEDIILAQFLYDVQ